MAATVAHQSVTNVRTTPVTRLRVPSWLLASLALLALFAGIDPPTGRADSPTKQRSISTLYLFVHCLGDWESAAVRKEYSEKYKTLFATEGPKKDVAICMLTCGPESKAIADLARQTFGDRCIVDPDDKSLATKGLIADDLERALYQRGSICEWTPYEMVASTNARRWTEGLKIELRNRGRIFDPNQLRMIACGQQWGGCLTKYSIFMARYLGLTKPAEIRPDLSAYAGYPLKARFRECVPMDRHVRLYLFETADGKPMAQFLDGLRGVSDPPHLATVPVDASQVQLVAVPPTEQQQVQQVANPLAANTLLVDVGDGCRPVITSVVANKMSFAEFRNAMSKATISPFARKHASRTHFVPFGCSELLCPK